MVQSDDFAPLNIQRTALLRELREAKSLPYGGRGKPGVYQPIWYTLSVSPFGLPALPEGEPRALRAIGRMQHLKYLLQKKVGKPEQMCYDMLRGEYHGKQ